MRPVDVRCQRRCADAVSLLARPFHRSIVLANGETAVHATMPRICPAAHPIGMSPPIASFTILTLCAAVLPTTPTRS